ncbi:hypothetical protein GCM10017579_27950 [Nocardioides luteus]|uniref:Uncharacterized protein n=1 Tax=Nocardioides luteus TaxID=1844 RepID=A0ABQ5SZ87_9ACTN|nr:hypothetical protein GCM10017579_27950 [Nocardioides luteus]
MPTGTAWIIGADDETRTRDINLGNQITPPNTHSHVLARTGVWWWLFMVVMGLVEPIGGILGARAGVRIAGAERYPFRHLAPLAGVRGLAPDVREPTPGRLDEGWRACAATAAPALVIGGRTGVARE